MTCDRCKDNHLTATSTSYPVYTLSVDSGGTPSWHFVATSTDTSGNTTVYNSCLCECHPKCGHIQVVGTKCHSKPEHFHLLCEDCGAEVTPCKCGEGLDDDDSDPCDGKDCDCGDEHE